MTNDFSEDIRIQILRSSLLVEGVISHFLGGLLDIKDVRNSISLGNKGSTLSFNQKVHLLIDIGALPKDTKAKFKAFMEIRNQFMHNIEAKSYETCLSFTEGTDKFLLKTYPQDPKFSKEEQFKNAVSILSTDVFGLAVGVVNIIKAKYKKEGEAEEYKSLLEILEQSIQDSVKTLDIFIEKEIGADIAKEKINGLGKKIVEHIFGIAKNNFENHQKDKTSS
jgi:hypothetical protein